LLPLRKETPIANQLLLTASVVALDALRYTPAGLPALNVKLEHESNLMEAGQARTVKAAIKAVAFGTVAERLAKQATGSVWSFSGFLATPLNGKHVVYHLQDFS
jgi:primosomal replication protein N